ncbi:MAG: DUF2318 domain-containing protein [Acidobacteria bacterium]|nr:DUF2318 domain-containing protein [Acidobacteriota bacterium]
MRKIKPFHALAFVLVFSGAVLFLQFALGGGLGHPGFDRVAPGRDGTVRVSVADLEPKEVRFYHFLNPANQEVHFFIGRDEQGQLAVAFDANEICYKAKRGYRAEGAWVVCNKCDKSFRLAEVNAGGGGCKPVPLPFSLDGQAVVLTESDLLRGWRLFR